MPQCRGPTREFQLDRWSRGPYAGRLTNKRMVFCIRYAFLYSYTHFKTPVTPSYVANLDVWRNLCLVSLRSPQSNTLGRWSFA